MNRIFQPSADAILFRLSDAAEHYRGNKGCFKVIYRKNQKKIFTSLVKAFLFYISLDEEAALLDISQGSRLIETKIKLYLN